MSFNFANLLNKTYYYPIIRLEDNDENNIIQHYYENDKTEQAFLYIKTLTDLTAFNSAEYILQYSYFERDTIRINAEWVQNDCDVEYSKIISITRGSTSFEKVDDVFLIVKE